MCHCEHERVDTRDGTGHVRVKYVCMYVCLYVYVCMYVCMYVYMYWCMTTSMYCLYIGFDYTYIDVNALAQGIKSFLASLVWSQAVAGARTYGTDSPAITSQPR